MMTADAGCWIPAGGFVPIEKAVKKDEAQSVARSSRFLNFLASQPPGFSALCFCYQFKQIDRL
jgi:hypothetical protein